MIDKQDEQKERPPTTPLSGRTPGHSCHQGGTFNNHNNSARAKSETHATRRDGLISEQGMVEEEATSPTDPGKRYVFKTDGLAGEL